MESLTKADIYEAVKAGVEIALRDHEAKGPRRVTVEDAFWLTFRVSISIAVLSILPFIFFAFLGLGALVGR